MTEVTIEEWYKDESYHALGQRYALLLTLDGARGRGCNDWWQQVVYWGLVA